MKTKHSYILVIGISSFLFFSCSCPSDPTIDHHYTHDQLAYIAGIEGKRMTFEDANGLDYFIQVGPSHLTTHARTEHYRKGGGSFSCEPVTPTHITYSSSMNVESDISDFKWRKIHIGTNEEATAWIRFTSLDSTRTDFSGTLQSNTKIDQAVYLPNYQIKGTVYPFVNVIVSQPSGDSLFWTKINGFIKFTSRDKKEYFLKR